MGGQWRKTAARKWSREADRNPLSDDDGCYISHGKASTYHNPTTKIDVATVTLTD